ncbi:TonB-dependent receptor [Sphingomonas sp. AP4-R1]|uniref:TonB-dependent receptor plug domain-containing protein n=1 Tax=Sphingomonas sp. AP4-R1 TaxID=2735134 RepID=UPI001493725C|nr:TonB-dependent receptor [Sphingomonas sp. AP4-R1]QJU59282.1 TonB-dependent receptor [Sphingomonas sp. AP4-R1]
MIDMAKVARARGILFATLAVTCSTAALAQAAQYPVTGAASAETAAGDAAAAASPLPAATPAPDEAAGAPGQKQIEEIIVTGTAIRGVAPVGSATLNIGRAAILETGARSAGDIIAQLPQGSNIGTSQNSTGGRQQGVNLRGLGNNATLLLFDGHRWVPQGVINQVSDPSVIPFAAIDRVEVVTDGASAIYGSDAVAGVVNYILRRDYEGAELTGRFTHTLYDQYQAEGVAGHKWSTGGFMVGFSFSRQNRVKQNARDYLRYDLRPYGGNDNRFIGTTVYPGQTPALIIGSTVYGLPATNGAVPTAAQVLPLANQPTLYDPADLYDYFAQRLQYSGLLRFHQDIGDHIELLYTASYNRRENTARAQEALQNLSITVAPSSPYYIRGLPNPTANQTLVYNIGLNFPGVPLDQKNYEETFNNTLDLRADLGRNFQLKSYASWGVSTGCNVCQPQANTTIAAIITRDRVASFNPYLTGPQDGALPLIAAFLQEGRIRQFDTVSKIDGPLFDLPAGSVRIAAGGEYTSYAFSLTAQNKLNLNNAYQISRQTSSKRGVWSGFGEVFVPVFGPENAIPFVQRFDISAAVRYDRYSDAGSTTNPKFGITWKPIPDLTLRGSWGTSFRAPTLIESNPATVGQTNRAYVANGAGDPAIAVTLPATGQSAVLSRTGNTAGLRPESAHVWSLGADLTPRFAPTLKLGITYYNVNYKDRIENLPNQTLAISSAANRDLYRDYFIVAPQPTTCVNGNYATYNPAYLPFLNDRNAVFTPSTINDCTLTGIINGGRQNLGNVKQSGLDFTANYTLQTDLGKFTIGGNYSKILNLKKNLTSTGPLFDALDTYGFQVSNRGRGNIGYSRGGFTANVYANYIGSYLNNATITVAGVKLPDSKVPAWTTFDLSLSYRMPDDASGVLEGTRFSLNVQNFTDKAPPIVLVGTVGTTGVDTNNHNIFGRIWTFEITKKF